VLRPVGRGSAMADDERTRQLHVHQNTRGG
jgi:hypothetical protein